ncbi:MAG: hypothetical protein M1822_009349 [Bathelium mastoideum]|nr:MAG: hypothetical protein M1822_009349 [Bathelium mastoideum]
MSESEFDVKRKEHIPGYVMHDYLAAYAKHFGLTNHIQCDSKVDTAECRRNDGWLLSISPTKTTAGRQILARKIIVATGLTSQPFVPDLPGSETFEGPIVHSKQLAQHDSALRTTSSIVVLGNNKSAYDSAYAFASQGVKVHLLIRQSGKGPLWMVPAFVTPLKIWTEALLGMRMPNLFSPCIWGDADGFGFIRWLLNATVVGRLLVWLFWVLLTKDAESRLALDKSARTKKLKPWTSPFWQGSGVSIETYDGGFHDLVRRGEIEVHISEIEELLRNSVRLRSGVELKADAIITATGWSHKPPIIFLPAGIKSDLGLPGNQCASEIELELCKLADSEILDRFPILRNQPDRSPALRMSNEKTANAQLPHPWRLFRFLVPPAFISCRTIAFAGMLFTVRTSTCAEIQGLWIASFLDGTMDIESCLKHFSATKSRRFADDSLQARVRWDTMLMTQFGLWRYPSGFADRNPDFAFDSPPYFDLLLGDLGLRKWRKKSWLAEMTEQYLPEDHGDIVEEWMDLQRKEQ